MSGWFRGKQVMSSSQTIRGSLPSLCVTQFGHLLAGKNSADTISSGQDNRVALRYLSASWIL